MTRRSNDTVSYTNHCEQRCSRKFSLFCVCRGCDANVVMSSAKRKSGIDNLGLDVESDDETIIYNADRRSTCPSVYCCFFGLLNNCLLNCYIGYLKDNHTSKEF